uniref:cap-specific mRNA (nucleoside-2'-O-)-methyltransferase 2 n=1 Tax=Pristiophorus japonicus TaxID=55135 RepID=UPI00398E4E38
MKCVARKRARVEHMVDLSQFSRPVLNEIEELFNKKFTFEKPSGEPWRLPKVDEVCTAEQQHSLRLQALKESLNNVKNQLSDKELEKWHKHTAFTNRAGKVIPHVKRTMNAELCTQAWCKFHEILWTFALLPEEALRNGELGSVHLCEAPGAFIASLNHYLRSHRIPCDWSWVGNTLNPYHEGNDTGMMIMDDRLIAGTLPWWYFGPDDTGDIMVLKYLEGLIEFTQNMKTVHLVTADGSFDCQDNPGEQEALVSPLHYCETIAALQLLSPKGSFVLKMFTLFEHASVCLLYLLNCCFRQVHVFKPGTSKSGNSEVYAVCLGYAGKGALAEHLAQLVLSYGPEVVRESSIARAAVPLSFLQQLEDCCTFFHRRQTDTIRENLRLFGRLGEEETRQLETKRACAADFYLQRFRLRRADRQDWVLKRSQVGCSLAGRLLAHQNKKQHVGSYNERQELAGRSWQERVRKGSLGPQVGRHCPAPQEAGHSLEGAEGGLACPSWYMLEGRRLGGLASSPFCDVELLRSMGEAVAECVAAGGAALPPCRACGLYSEGLVLSELAALAGAHRKGGSPRDGEPLDCIVVGSPGSFPGPELAGGFRLRLCEAPLSERCTALHDGEPAYQRRLLGAVLTAVTQCGDGGALVLPVLSAFTRFTAGLVFVLQHCFRALDFVCPTSSDALGTLAVLLCAGFQRPSDLDLTFLTRLSERMDQLLGSQSEQPQQVLQFVPMELLLEGTLPEFLNALNTAVAQQRLHLVIQATT